MYVLSARIVCGVASLVTVPRLHTRSSPLCLGWLGGRTLDWISDGSGGSQICWTKSPTFSLSRQATLSRLPPTSSCSETQLRSSITISLCPAQTAGWPWESNRCRSWFPMICCLSVLDEPIDLTGLLIRGVLLVDYWTRENGYTYA